MVRSHLRSKDKYIQFLIDCDFEPQTTMAIYEHLHSKLHWAPTIKQLGNWLAQDPDLTKVFDGKKSHLTTWKIR